MALQLASERALEAVAVNSGALGFGASKAVAEKGL